MGGNGDCDGGKPKKMVFVTVGTTCFDRLVEAVDSDSVRRGLLERGYTDLVIQMGRGSYIPSKCPGEDGSLAVDYFTFSPSITDYLRAASLIISHAGSGSIFETLRLGKPLIVVVNEDLMDNHQSELAEELADRKHLFCARPRTLHQIVASMDLESLIPYTPDYHYYFVGKRHNLFELRWLMTYLFGSLDFVRSGLPLAKSSYGFIELSSGTHKAVQLSFTEVL